MNYGDTNPPALRQGPPQQTLDLPSAQVVGVVLNLYEPTPPTSWVPGVLHNSMGGVESEFFFLVTEILCILQLN